MSDPSPHRSPAHPGQGFHRREEQESLAEFGERYRRYMDATPAFIPKWNKSEGGE